MIGAIDDTGSQRRERRASSERVYRPASRPSDHPVWVLSRGVVGNKVILQGAMNSWRDP